MSEPTANSAPTLTHQAALSDTDELTESQIEFMEDLRAGLLDMKHGRVQPAREALRELRRELEAEDNGNRPGG